MRTRTGIAFLACCALLAPAQAAAQQTAAPQPAVQPATRWYQPRMGLEFLVGSMDETTADDQGTGTSARGLQFALGVTALRVVDVSVDLGIMGLPDEASFSQETTQGEQESTVAAGIATVAAGLRTPALRLGGPISVSGGVNVGHTFLSAERSITNCLDCHAEDVSIGAGSFWEPGVLVFHNRTGLSARYRMYGDGSDVRNVVLIGLVVSAQPKPRAVVPVEGDLPAPPAGGR
jgi:hypothetical protein